MRSLKRSAALITVLGTVTQAFPSTTIDSSLQQRQQHVIVPQQNQPPGALVIQNVRLRHEQERAPSVGKTPIQMQTKVPSTLAQRLKVGSYFALWYVLNVVYNISNKNALNTLALPWTVGTLQLGVGSLWVAILWSLKLRKAPSVTSNDVKRMIPVAMYHGGGQLATVLSLGAGAVSFTHIVKAAEPLFSALVSAVCFKQIFKLPVYLSLIPVICGVGVACFKELGFSWISFIAAMSSNLLFALRANFSKPLMSMPPKKNMTPANLYASVTMLAFIICVPIAALLEFKSIEAVWSAAVERVSGHAANPALYIIQLVGLSGITHYLNNEVMYVALNSVHPVTLAVANTVKRVFIIVASLIVFRNPVTRLGIIGSIVAIAGVQLYSLALVKYK